MIFFNNNDCQNLLDCTFSPHLYYLEVRQKIAINNEVITIHGALYYNETRAITEIIII